MHVTSIASQACSELTGPYMASRTRRLFSNDCGSCIAFNGLSDLLMRCWRVHPGAHRRLRLELGRLVQVGHWGGCQLFRTSAETQKCRSSITYHVMASVSSCTTERLAVQRLCLQAVASSDRNARLPYSFVACARLHLGSHVV